VTLYTIWQVLNNIFFSPDGIDMTKDCQKKSKRKGRNKQEVMAVSQVEIEPEAVKTPIDLMKASTHHHALITMHSSSHTVVHMLYPDHFLLRLTI